MEKIPNYFQDLYLCYRSFHKNTRRSFEDFYEKNKELIFNDGMSKVEICYVLDISESTLNKTLTTAYNKIRKNLEECYG